MKAPTRLFYLFLPLIVVGVVLRAAAAELPPLLDPESQPRFVNPLPIPARVDATGGGLFDVTISEFQQHLGLYHPVSGAPLITRVWGYNGSYPAATFVARRDVPVQVKWINNLTDYSLQLPIDQTLHWADPLLEAPKTGPYTGPIPVVTHLHGGHTESNSDGLPEAWFTPGLEYVGAQFVKDLYTYDNNQEAATLWYHDHALGITRLNVYAGMAGFYLLRDANEDSLVAANQLPSGPYEIEIVVQDRMFTADGQLYYPAGEEPEIDEDNELPHPSVLPEFFGDFILVNGAAWPVLDVEPRQYRFRMLNGSDSRFYNLRIVGPGAVGASGSRHAIPWMWQIGSDDGFLETPVALNQLLMGPGERADIVVDFSNPALEGATFIVRNNARAPYPKGETVDPATTGQIMAFRVSKPLDLTQPLTTLPQDLRPLYGPIASLVQSGATRSLLLFEGEDEYGRLRPQLGTTTDGVLLWDDPITENPMLDDIEVWEIYNATEDAHPIHLHLVAFQVLDRQKFRADIDPVTAALSRIRKIGRAADPEPGEQGWKDTVITYPGEVTRVIARFDREGRYVWHCHILSHEDHEMMRPYFVGPVTP